MIKFLIGVLLGAIITNLVERWLRERAQLVYYLQIILDHNVQFLPTPSANNPNPPVQTIRLYTHSIAIQNNGSRVANNVEVSHAFLPRNITVNPADVQHTIDRTRGVISFNAIIPRQLVTIGYLNEGTPYTREQILATVVRSSEGFARPLAMTQFPIMPRWFNRTVWALLILGVLATVWVGYRLSPYITYSISWFWNLIKQ